MPKIKMTVWLDVTDEQFAALDDDYSDGIEIRGWPAQLSDDGEPHWRVYGGANFTIERID